MQAGPVFGWLCVWKAMLCLGLKGLLPVPLPSGLVSIPLSGDSEPEGKEKNVLGSRFSWPQKDLLESQRERPWFEGSPCAALSADHVSPGPSLTQLTQQMCELWVEGMSPNWVVVES